MTPPYMRQDPFMCVTSRIHKCDMTHRICAFTQMLQMFLQIFFAKFAKFEKFAKFAKFCNICKICKCSSTFTNVPFHRHLQMFLSLDIYNCSFPFFANVSRLGYNCATIHSTTMTLQHTAAHYDTLQHTVLQCDIKPE